VTWLRVPERLHVSPAAAGLWLAAFAHVGLHHTSGVVSRAALADVPPPDGSTIEALVRELTSFGLWHGQDHDCNACPDVEHDSFVIHDFARLILA
jgi:hypothetical protein